MSWHAVSALGDAVGATRELLWPVRAGPWLKLAGVCAFVGGFGSAAFRAEVPGDLVVAGSESLTAARQSPEQAIFLGVLILAAGLALLGYLLVRSLLEFVLYDALVSREVRVRRTLGRQWRAGLQLFLFRLALVSALLVVILAGAALVALGAADASLATPAGPLGIDSLVLGAVLLAAGGYAVVAGFTTRFVAPIMLVADRGVVAAWRRLLGTLAAQPGQYLAYLGVGLVVRFAADVLALSALVLVALALSLPLVAVLGPLILLAAGGGSLLAAPSVYVFATGLVGASLGALLAALFVLRVPFVAYVRYYALLVLAGTDPELPIPAAGEEFTSPW